MYIDICMHDICKCWRDHRSCGGPLRKDGASHAAGAGQPRGYACIYHESIASPTAPYRRGDREKRGRSRLLFIDWRGGEAGKIIKAFNASDLSARPDEQGPKNQRRRNCKQDTHTHTFRRRWFLGFSFCRLHAHVHVRGGGRTNQSPAARRPRQRSASMRLQGGKGGERDRVRERQRERDREKETETNAKRERDGEMAASSPHRRRPRPARRFLPKRLRKCCTQACRHAGTQACRQAGMQACRPAGTMCALYLTGPVLTINLANLAKFC